MGERDGSAKSSHHHGTACMFTVAQSSWSMSHWSHPSSVRDLLCLNCLKHACMRPSGDYPYVKRTLMITAEYTINLICEHNIVYVHGFVFFNFFTLLHRLLAKIATFRKLDLLIAYLPVTLWGEYILLFP